MNELFNVEKKVTIVTGGYGVLGSSIAKYMAGQGAIVIILGRSEEKASAVLKEIKDAGGEAEFYASDVLNLESLEQCKQNILSAHGRIDVLVNVAGGNVPGATLTADQNFFDMKLGDWDKVTALNINGTIYPSYVFGEVMAKQKKGSIINISSMAAMSALTRVPGYSASKAAISNFTQWLATEMALKFGDGVRVNAIAPGFFIGEQNRNILINPDGSLTERSQKVIAKTPMRRFGDITELNGAVQFLCSDAASFVTGTIIPVDGGFSAFSGV